MKISAIFLLCISAAAISFGQVEGNPNTKPTELGRTVYGLGLAAGMAGGAGFSFRHHLPSIFSYQLVGGIIRTNSELNYDFGGEVQFDLTRGEANRFFAAGAMGYYYSGDNGSNGLSASTRFGVGIGNEWANQGLFHVTLEVLMTFFNDGTIIPTPALSAHYYFF